MKQMAAAIGVEVSGPEYQKKKAPYVTALMEAHGFVHFPFEYWHFNKGDTMAHTLAGLLAPARYGPVHWDAAANTVTPYADALIPLNPLAQMEAEIFAALGRARTIT